MDLIEISYFDLGLAGLLVILLAAVSWWARLGIGHRLLIAAARTIIQLSLIALVLEALFAADGFFWIALMATVMVLIAGREVASRQERRFIRGQSFAIGTLSIFLSGFSVTVFALLVIIGPDPWYSPQYAIPLLGMMLGNTMTGVAVSLDRLTQSAWDHRAVIENRLMLGETWQSAIGHLRRDAMRSGMIPTINAMATAGIVSLPGMMTGQILSGTTPALAVRYQILIMLAIAVGTGFGTMAGVLIASRNLFDGRQRLRLDRLQTPNGSKW
ncbi:iron export ABC transporter permease subunit FetB [Natronospirillum operosum]|uniref:Iron export ABC transporter permease subunit FetB n=1 Tax=Natronospirillum operosum TaxID=2759953 RepID=A0A4Z0WC78_9GAMM|nr:iron export ABC transporter permease subunit FetB [Natronospirillum operosum]TGG92475.1 iron export ABC transporter permease subunit FetB [Natronospirillum operosum]